MDPDAIDEPVVGREIVVRVAPAAAIDLASGEAVVLATSVEAPLRVDRCFTLRRAGPVVGRAEHTSTAPAPTCRRGTSRR